MGTSSDARSAVLRIAKALLQLENSHIGRMTQDALVNDTVLLISKVVFNKTGFLDSIVRSLKATTLDEARQAKELLHVLTSKLYNTNLRRKVTPKHVASVQSVLQMPNLSGTARSCTGLEQTTSSSKRGFTRLFGLLIGPQALCARQLVGLPFH